MYGNDYSTKEEEVKNPENDQISIEQEMRKIRPKFNLPEEEDYK